MWAWIIIGYAAFVLVIAGCAGFVAIFCGDKERRADAFKVLKLVWSVATLGVLAAVAIRLNEAGLP